MVKTVPTGYTVFAGYLVLARELIQYNPIFDINNGWIKFTYWFKEVKKL